VFSYLITWFLKKLPFGKGVKPWLKRGPIRLRLIAFLPAIVGTILGTIPGLIDIFLITAVQGRTLPWHVSVMFGFFGGLLAYPLHGWIHKGLYRKDK